MYSSQHSIVSVPNSINSIDNFNQNNLKLKGKRIAIIGKNRYEWAVSYYSIVCGVGIVVPLDKGLPMEEIENSLIISKADAIIFEGILKTYLMKEFKRAFGNDVRINTPDLESGNSILSVSFKDEDAQGMMLYLADNDVYVSAGSACNSGSPDPSHVLQAIGVPEEYINGTIRISLSHHTTKDDCDKLIDLLKVYKSLGGKNVE